MRAQLRTYHSIPSLQAQQDPNSYKQLQDAPRLKSILKGASEDSHQPSTIEKIKAFPIPRTNPVNLIFVLSQYALKISETHFVPPRDFYDLVMRATLSSRSRAKAFLWLIWYYLESDFSGHAAENNPFGPGQHGDATGGLPLKVPPFEHLTEEQANAENVDTEPEKAYGEMKRLERKRILEVDESIGPPMKKGKRSESQHNIIRHITPRHSSRVYNTNGIIDQLPGHDNVGQMNSSETDHTPSPSPVEERRYRPMKAGLDSHISSTNAIYEDSTEERYWAANTADERYSKNPTSANLRSSAHKSRLEHRSDPVTPAPPGAAHPILHANNLSGINQRRPRPETSHQKAVNINRKMRIEHILHRQMVSQHSIIRKQKRRKSTSFGFTAMKRIKQLADGYDTEHDQAWGPGGLVPNSDEDEDFGEEALRQKKSIDRAVRRLMRDEVGGSLGGLVKGYRKRKRKPEVYPGRDARERSTRKRNKTHAGYSAGEGRLRIRPTDRSREGAERREEGLDDLDLDLLGESRDDEQAEDSGADEDSGMDVDTEVDGEGEGDEGTEEEL